jgi:hypothetical protein
MTKNTEQNDKKEKKPTNKSSKKIQAGEKKQENNKPVPVKCELIEPNSNLDELINQTTLKDKGLANTGIGQNRNLDTTDIVKVDEDWLPKLLNLEGAGEKYKNIGENELNFVVNIIKYNNNITAYKLSYDCTNLSMEYIEQRASDLKRRKDVADLLGILRERMVKQTEKQLQWQFSDSVNSLKYLVHTAIEEVENARNEGKANRLNMTRVTAITAAVKELNQMMGYTEKSVKINNSVTIIGKEDDLTD